MQLLHGATLASGSTSTHLRNTVKENELVIAGTADLIGRSYDFVKVGHATRDNHGQTLFGNMAKKGPVRDLAGANFEAANADLREHVCALLVKWRGHKHDTLFLGIILELNVLGLVQGQALQHIVL